MLTAGIGRYRCLVDEVVGRANAVPRKALDIERPRLETLPPRRPDDFEEAGHGNAQGRFLPPARIPHRPFAADRPSPAGQDI
jgi:hypothetical protein